MLRLGVIGTSWITESFIDAAHKTDKYKLSAIYSRTLERAKEFGSKYYVDNLYTDIDEMCKSNTVDIVYIASPNGLHFKHTSICLNNKIHVICEKPLFTSVKQFNDAYQLAQSNNVFLFEAIRTIFDDKYKVLKDQLSKIGQVRYGYFNFMKYSSKYDAYKDGNNPPVFQTKLSGGANYDLGVYLIHTVLYLFGKPKNTHYIPLKLENGIDGLGSLTFIYNDFYIQSSSSKISTSKIPNEIQGEDGTIVFDELSDIKYINIHKNDNVETIKFDTTDNLLYDEALSFHKIIENNDLNQYQGLVDNSLTVMEILEKSRVENNIIFWEIM